MIQVEDEKMIFLDANAFYSYYGRSKLGMTSEPVDEKRLKKYLDQQSEKSLPTSVYIEIIQKCYKIYLSLGMRRGCHFLIIFQTML